MNMTDFKKLIKSGDIDEVGLVELPELDKNYERTGRFVYEIYADGKSAAAGVFGRKVTNSNGDEKTYTSVDRALSAIKKAGWRGVVDIKQWNK